MKKRIIALLLCLALLCAGFCMTAWAAESETVCKTVPEVMRFLIGDRNYTVPLRILPAVLSESEEETPVYLIAMVGVKPVKGQVNVVQTCFPAAFNKENVYFDLVKQTVLAEVPAGSRLVFVCHSLGGMVAQQLRADNALKEQYEILHVLTAGSPFIMTKGGEGTLVRLADQYDLIPLLSPATVLKPAAQFRQVCRENGGYVFNPDAAHNLSYLREDVWGAYDALGVKNGNTSLCFDASLLREFGAA